MFKRKQTNVRTITEKKVSKEFLAAFHKLPLLSDLCTTLVKQQADIFLFDYKVSGTNAEENVSRPIQKIRRPVTKVAVVSAINFRFAQSTAVQTSLAEAAFLQLDVCP